MTAQTSCRVLSASLLLAFAGVVSAVPVATTGSGSSVTTVNAFADFESTNALTDNPYLENGLEFSRTGLTFDNNGCGFAGCAGGWAGAGVVWSGNYMYGVGDGGYFTMKTTGSNVFTGVEFMVANGYLANPMDVIWETYLGGSLTGSGVLNVAMGTIFGLNDASGFDEVRYTGSSAPAMGPAFDSFRAQYGTAVPAPAPLTLLGASLLAFGGLRRRQV